MEPEKVLVRAIEQIESTQLQLTDRWTPLIPHGVQQSLFWHTSRFRSIPAARRTGKTELAKRRGILDTVMKRAWPARIAFGAPTYTRAKEIFFDDLEQMIPSFWVREKKESLNMMEFIMHWGARIRLIGLQKPEVVEGVLWDNLYIDEFADCKEKCFELKIRPALSTRKRLGGAWLMGVPDEVGENQIEHERIFRRGLQYGQEGADKNYCSFWWTSKEIIEPDEFESLTGEMDDISFAQEMEGMFVRSGGKAFPTFVQQVHADADYADYTNKLGVDHIIDFGSANSASLIGQHYKNSAWIVDEIPMHGGSTEGHCDAFIERCGERGFSMHRLSVYGDAAGRTPSSTTGQSDYDTMAEYYRGYNVDWNQLLAAPPIKDTINSIRGALLNRKRQIRLYIHPRCKNLIKEMNEAEWPPKNSLREYHFLAGLRYYCYSLFGASVAGIVSVSRATLSDARANNPARFSSRYTP